MLVIQSGGQKRGVIGQRRPGPAARFSAAPDWKTDEWNYFCHMNIDKAKAVAFSGHRTFKAAAGHDLFSSAEPAMPLDRRLEGTLRALAAEGYTDFLCGMAEGFDLLAARCVVRLRDKFPAVRLIAAIPFPGQDDRFPPELRERYRRLLSLCDCAVVLSPVYTPDCFHRRNDFLTDNASVLVCYYNGTKGGTAYTVKRALHNGLRIINLFRA